MTIRVNSLGTIKKKIKISNKKIKSVLDIGLTKEQILIREIKNIARDFIEIEQRKSNLIEIILKNLKNLDFSEFISYPKYYIKERFIKKGVKPTNIGGLNVISVDGSSVVKNFMNVDFSFLKAIAVKYHFNKNHLARIQYYPDLNGFNNYYVQGNYINTNENIIENKVSIDMNFMEIRLLNSVIEKNRDIDMIIIDGSIVITPINLIFSKDHELSKKYDRLLKEYQKLYLNCKENRIILIGSIKDTRTSALTHLLRDSIQLLISNHHYLNDFVKINYRQIFNYFSDLDLFNRVLQKSERSSIFHCKREIDKIRDTGIKKEIPYYFPLTFYAFYIKTALYDTPCRIEFFTDEAESYKNASKKADVISSLLLPISSLNEHYGLPIPQIEAHKRAVFNPNEINLLFNNLTRILNKSGFTLLEKRRNRRPF
ncbi:MAG: DNA double-strand break repair nuclease NurA [Promethearchaeota archaeon]